VFEADVVCFSDGVHILFGVVCGHFDVVVRPEILVLRLWIQRK
jgi:hypothetical protein